MRRARLLLSITVMAVAIWTPSMSGLLHGAGATPVSALWEQPVNLHDADLFNGPWGAQLAPDPSATYTFVRKKRDGVNPGMIVSDPLGRVWHVKQSPSSDRGDEGPVEVMMSRVLSAVGYHQPPVYYLASFTIADGSGTRREPGGRFRLDEPSMRAVGEWSWQENPFVGTRPHQALLVILLMFNSWDLKNSNNTLYDVQLGDRTERWYVVRDLGGSLGESGRRSPKRNNIDRFERNRFITGVHDGVVEFDYDGWHPSLLRSITVEDVLWASDLLGGLSDQQWRDAFRAGGYPPALADRFIRKLQANIAEGRAVAGGAKPGTNGR